MVLDLARFMMVQWAVLEGDGRGALAVNCVFGLRLRLSQWVRAGYHVPLFH